MASWKASWRCQVSTTTLTMLTSSTHSTSRKRNSGVRLWRTRARALAAFALKPLVGLSVSLRCARWVAPAALGIRTVLQVASSRLSLSAGALEALRARAGVVWGDSLGVVFWEVAAVAGWLGSWSADGPATLARGSRSSVLAAPRASSRLMMTAGSSLRSRSEELPQEWTKVDLEGRERCRRAAVGRPSRTRGQKPLGRHDSGRAPCGSCAQGRIPRMPRPPLHLLVPRAWSECAFHPPDKWALSCGYSAHSPLFCAASRRSE
uniref:Uncharacterized protein n=1 Tax=Ixodes ricinus TaxID=34613 RepID=A0A6B0V4W9_IXORI